MALETMLPAERVPTSQDCRTEVKLVVEGLLAHFFSADQPKYVLEDVKWFLKLLNKQGHWYSEREDQETDSEEGSLEDSEDKVVGEQVGDSLKPQMEV